jgi:hypothetical protein
VKKLLLPLFLLLASCAPRVPETKPPAPYYSWINYDWPEGTDWKCAADSAFFLAVNSATVQNTPVTAEDAEFVFTQDITFMVEEDCVPKDAKWYARRGKVKP